MFGAYTYFEYVKTPNFSDNFNENYEAILTRWKTALAIWGFIAFVALVVALLALFTKESTKQVESREKAGVNALFPSQNLTFERVSAASFETRFLSRAFSFSL